MFFDEGGPIIISPSVYFYTFIFETIDLSNLNVFFHRWTIFEKHWKFGEIMKTENRYSSPQTLGI